MLAITYGCGLDAWGQVIVCVSSGGLKWWGEGGEEVSIAMSNMICEESHEVDDPGSSPSPLIRKECHHLIHVVMIGYWSIDL